jgi:hypothetical protein
MDLVLFNGAVLTMASSRTASAVLIRDGRIASVGESCKVLREAPPAARRIDLAGRALLPGFHDAHAHIWKIGHLLTTMLDLRKTRSIAQLSGQLRAQDARLPRGAWLLGRGFNEAFLAEKRRPARSDLDLAVPHRPVVLTRTCGHIYAANSLALEHAGITEDTPAPEGGIIERDEHSIPTGLLHETAMGLMRAAMPQPTAAEYEAMIDAALRHQISLGITSSSDCGITPELLSAYRAMDTKHVLPARVNVMLLRLIDGATEPLPLPEQSVSDRLRVDTVKFLADGGLSGATAALSTSYRHSDTRGVLRFREAHLLELCREAHNAGWRIATHAIGDVAIGQVLGVYEALGKRPWPLRHRIEHFGLPDDTHLKRAAALGVIVVPQAIFLHSLGRNFRKFVPDSLLPRTYPIRSMLDAGLTVALSSDAPVVEDDNPLSGVEEAVTRRDEDGYPIAPEQSISIQEALHCYTMAGATASGDEHMQGSIELGKRADLAVLSGNPLHTEPHLLHTLHVDMTLIDGEVVYER